jgi:hypothetical protein
MAQPPGHRQLARDYQPINSPVLQEPAAAAVIVTAAAAATTITTTIITRGLETVAAL